MGAIVAATLTAVGSAAVAALQAKTLQREVAILHEQWDVETGFHWLRFRRDAAHATTPAPAGMFRRILARQRRSPSLEFDPVPIDDQADTVLKEDFFANEAPLRTEHRAQPAREKVPLESLRFAPFLLDTSALAAWAALIGVLTLVGLVGPQINAGATQITALLIPLGTLALAGFYPAPWAWAMLAVAWLQGMNAWGYSLAGGIFQPGDAAFCVAMYLANAAAVSLLAARTMQRHRRWIVMRAE
jgi:hypothetical protein